MKRVVAFLTLLALLCAGCGALAEENLLVNGDFSAVTDGMPDGWRTEMWYTDAGISLLSAEQDGYEGSCARVVNVDANDARFAQTVRVRPGAMYRVSGLISASGCDPDGYGATLSISGLFVYSDSVYDTGDGWQRVELYGVTGDDQTELTVFARVGAYGYLTTGSARFDDLEVVEVDEAPEGVEINDFSPADFVASDDEEDEDAEPPRATETWLLFACLYGIALLALARKRGRSAPGGNDAAALCLLAGGLALAFVLRALVAVRVRGYNTDINCFTAWSERIFSTGLTKFYDPDYFCDYPPGYMLLLWPVSALRRLLRLNSNVRAYLVILKLLPMLSDLAGALLIWRTARKRFTERAAVTLALLYAFNPAVLVDSAAWGQIDGVLTLAVVLCALCAVDGRYTASLLWFGAAMLIKPQALLVAPLGLAAIVIGILAAPDDVRKTYLQRAIVGVAGCLGLIYAVAFLFCLGQARGIGDALARPVTWLVQLYTGTMTGYRYVTVNTLNVYYLLGLNWRKMEAFGGFATLAWLLFALSYAYAGAMLYLGRKRPRRLFLTGGLLIVLICTFGPMIHERYIFPAVLLLSLAFACERDVRLLVSLAVLSVTLFLNEVLVLQGGMTAANFGHLQDSERWLNDGLCVVNILNALFLAWSTLDICAFDGIWPLHGVSREPVPAGRASLEATANWKLGLKRLDALLIASVTLAYAVVAFVNLGTLRAPQTGWTSSVSGESVTFDLGSSQPFHMTYYGGICNSTFDVELSNDGEAWTDPCAAQYNQGEIFRWIWYVPMDDSGSVLYEDTVPAADGSAYVTYANAGEAHPAQAARYVRITARSAGLNLFEVGFLDLNGGVLPILSVSQSGQTEASTSSAALLIDEQDTVAEYPSYLNSTYFDEIYHARTAYEQIHAMNAYEWTHPPLGKAMMMLGIEIFGMTPFGWRFMGALMGVLMVPLMYLLAMQLTKDTKLSFIAMCLMALDSMHFTQTRIATIDSYAVFWIMLMYLFMFRYCQMSWNRESLGRTLVPLGLCGVTMGIAWATKWIGIYASAGLAFLFFWTLWRRLREAKYLPEGHGTLCKAVATLLFCVVFFVVVPALIYYFSYTFQLRGEGVRGFGDMLSRERLKRVIELQKSIFSYHAGLGGDTHYFRSPWYQWPIIWWPMWYYSGNGWMPQGVISSISCMGNPAVWWFGLIALVFVILRMAWVRRAPKAYMLVAVGFASQFLPWVIVPRSTFIYHYFASVPFIILASALFLDWIRTRPRRAAKALGEDASGAGSVAFTVTAAVLLTAALLLFIAFYPLESGLPVAESYARYLRWFEWYNY